MFERFFIGETRHRCLFGGSIKLEKCKKNTLTEFSDSYVSSWKIWCLTQFRFFLSLIDLIIVHISKQQNKINSHLCQSANTVRDKDDNANDPSNHSQNNGYYHYEKKGEKIKFKSVK